MSSITTYNLPVSKSQEIFRLVNPKTKEDIATTIAIAAFKDYQDTKIGLVHQFKKFTTSLCAYGTAIGVPVAAVGGTFWYLFGDLIANPSKISKIIHMGNTPLISDGNPVTDIISPVTRPYFILTTLATLGVADYAFGKMTGFTPVRSVVSWSVNMLSTSLLYTAYKAGELATASYDQDELEKNRRRQITHELIVSDFIKKYDNHAEDFVKAFENASMPAAKLELKRQAELFLAALPTIKKFLSQFDLKPFEVEQILFKYSNSLEIIKSHPLNLESPNLPNAGAYNAQLLSLLNENEVKKAILTSQGQDSVEIFKAVDVGMLHTAKGYAKAGVSALSKFAITETALLAITSAAYYYLNPEGFTKNLSSFTSEITLPKEEILYPLAATLLLSITHSAYKASQVLNRHQKEREMLDLTKEKNSMAINEEVKALYEGIALNFQKRYEQAKGDAHQMRYLLLEIHAIEKNIPVIISELKKTGAIQNPENVLEKLKDVILKISRDPKN